MLLLAVGGFAFVDACDEPTYTICKASVIAEFSLVVLFWQVPQDQDPDKNTSELLSRNSRLKPLKGVGARWHFQKQKASQLFLTSA